MLIVRQLVDEVMSAKPGTKSCSSDVRRREVERFRRCGKAAKDCPAATLSPVLDTEEFQTLSSAVRVNWRRASQRGSLRPHNDDHTWRSG